ncbi:hypothetical protein Scep_029716 [Stephania cephalantha]|uniref:Uncharacterized protein n=1 Tax=Stephania cephalantha TaxID=152367 RepID=A0AAP0DY84_9MAGN
MLLTERGSNGVAEGPARSVGTSRCGLCSSARFPNHVNCLVVPPLMLGFFMSLIKAEKNTFANRFLMIATSGGLNQQRTGVSNILDQQFFSKYHLGVHLTDNACLLYLSHFLKNNF